MKSQDRETSSLDTDQQHSSLPMDLMMDIFSRLSLKSIAICRCVSKQWGSVLGHSGFRDLLLTRSQARPRLLFACVEDNKVIFLSSPQPQSSSPTPSPPVAADYHMSFSFDHPVQDISTSLNGFVCVYSSGCRSVNAKKSMEGEELVICNPSTGQSLTVPRMNSSRMTRFFGYDTIEKLHKVLGMIWLQDDRTVDHQVLTLGVGGGGTTWRTTGCGVPCSTWQRQNICINGVIYYVGRECDQMIVCFDVRSEKYIFVKFPDMIFWPVVLDFYGKLALVVLVSGIALTATSESIVMWVLQDPGRCTWSKRVYILPPMWKDVVDPREHLEIVGGTGPDELVMSPRYSSQPFHFYYCNFLKETVTRVVIQGMAFGTGRRYSIHTYLNHVEDVKRMEL
ncbi:unnamed protein product [Brassica rapa subsp. trilocularis]